MSQTEEARARDVTELAATFRGHWFHEATKRCACGAVVDPDRHAEHVAEAVLLARSSAVVERGLREEEAVLCYVDGNEAWFTTAARQWGDDWDDAPYEHNAGRPYEWREGSGDPYELVRVFWDAPMDTPDEGHRNSPYSVEDINAGKVPWLRRSRWSPGLPVAIFAGATVDEFKAAIREAGGKVFVEDVALGAALERERDLRQALLEGSYFHVKHDGTPRQPETCHDCRAIRESRALAETLRSSDATETVSVNSTACA